MKPYGHAQGRPLRHGRPPSGHQEIRGGGVLDGMERRPCYDVLHLLRFTTMSRSITQRELRNDSAAVLRDVQGGQTITVTRNGDPVAELRPVPRRRFVQRAVIAEAAGLAPRIDLARFRADLDDVVDASVHD